MKIKSQKDFFSGLMFAVVGVAFGDESVCPQPPAQLVTVSIRPVAALRATNGDQGEQRSVDVIPLAHPSHLDVRGFIEKLNRYTDREQPRDLGVSRVSGRLVWRGIFEGGASFARWYLLERGWRDGRHGFIHSAYLGMYRFTMWAKAATAEPVEPPTSDAAFAAWYKKRRRP